MISHQDVVHFDQMDETYSLRKHWSLIKLLVKQRTQLLNQLNNLVYQANPELLIYCRRSWPDWLLELLKLFPTAQDLAEATIAQLDKIPYVESKKVQEILRQARQSVASANDPVSREMIKAIVEEVIHKGNLIESCKKYLIESCTFEDVTLIASIPGIGKYSAVGLAIEIGTWLRFSSSKKMASFFGLHPIFKQSGDKTWVTRMSKRGSAEVRALLFMCTMVAIRHNPVIRELYAHNLSKGKCKMSAIGICMHKLLRIIYGVLKSGIPSDASIDQSNRAKKPIQRKETQQGARRLQRIDDKAPVSVRQNKKRKEQSQSQGELVTECEIKAPALSHCAT